jgi:hypothetical protein
MSTWSNAVPSRLSPDAIANFGARSLSSNCRAFQLNSGTYIIRIPASADAGKEDNYPATLVSVPPGANGDVEILTAGQAQSEWVLPSGGAIVVRVRASVARIMITSFGHREPGYQPALQFFKLDEGLEGDTGKTIEADTVEPNADESILPRDVPLRVLLHVQGTGDRTVNRRGWLGSPGKRLRIEGFSIEPESSLRPADLEYRVKGAHGEETGWVRGGTFCGTRGRGIPLYGFAIRLRPPANDLFDVVYSGVFFSGRRSAPARNGQMCSSTVPNDPLSAMKIQILSRSGTDPFDSMS